MKDVAALADVSLSTVSRVINDTGGVRPDMVSRVERAVRLLGYETDLTASSLRRTNRTSATIGMIFDDVANVFFSAVQRGVEDVVRPRGVLAFSASSDLDPRRERDLTRALIKRRVDGLIIVPSGEDQSYLQRERRAGVGLVFVDRMPRFIDADAVISDNRGGAGTGVKHLITAGHRRIGFLGDRAEVFTAAERLRGYRDALGAHGLPEEGRLVRQGVEGSSAAYDAARAMLSSPEPPTALFSAQNLITIGAIRALRDLGLQRTIAFVGFDDVPLADALEPGLTVVRQDPQQLGRAAAEALLGRLDGDVAGWRRIVLPTVLVERGSGELRPA
jgi:LacI family transcriptional regulator